MNSLLNAIERTGNSVLNEVFKFDPIAWGVVAVCSVVFCCMLLRGNVLVRR